MKLTCFERWFINHPRHARQTERTALALLEHVELPSQPRCLEIGCGQGALARLLIERFGARVIATDYDPQQVALAQQRLAGLGRRVEFRVVDARAMPFDDAQFDAVFSFGVLHHILDGWGQAVAETARVLRPGGWFVLSDFVASTCVDRLMRQLLPRLDYLGEAALHARLAENGLQVKHCERSHGGPVGSTKGLGLMGQCAAVARKTWSD
jgi:ubiquinone/menaquinone biosynthesis C-methylase UbiE